MEETIFNFIDSVLFNKKKLNTINEGETQFNLYMLNRWSSMYSADIAQIINETTNLYGKTFSSKQEQYEFALNLLPKVKKKRINYIKKNKEEKEELNIEVKLVANAMELSQREILEYISFLENERNQENTSVVD
jgi:cell division protein FtsX